MKKKVIFGRPRQKQQQELFQKKKKKGFESLKKIKIKSDNKFTTITTFIYADKDTHK